MGSVTSRRQVRSRGLFVTPLASHETAAAASPGLRSQVLGLQPCALRDPGQHPGPDLFVVVEGEHEVSPTGAGKRSVGAGLTLDHHPILKRAASTRRARVLGHALMLR